MLLLIMLAMIVGTPRVVFAADEGFTPQTSSTRTDVPSPSVLPATGTKHVLLAFVGVSGLGYLCHRRLRRNYLSATKDL